MTTPEPKVVSPPRRGRPIKWILGLVLVAVGIFAGIFIYSRVISVPRAERYLAEVKSQLSPGWPTLENLGTLFGPLPSEAENAAPVYRQTLEQLKPLWKWEGKKEPPAAGECFELRDIWIPGFASSDESSALSARDPVRLRTFLAKFEPALRLRDQAVRLPHFGASRNWPKHYLMGTPEALAAVELANLSLLEAALARSEGRNDEAYARLIDVLHMAAHMEQEPLEENFQVALFGRTQVEKMLIELLSAAPPSPARAAELKSALSCDEGSKLRTLTITTALRHNALFQDAIDGKCPGTFVFVKHWHREPIGVDTAWADIATENPSTEDKIVSTAYRWKKAGFIRGRGNYLKMMDRYAQAMHGQPLEITHQCDEIYRDQMRIKRGLIDSRDATFFFVGLTAGDFRCSIECLELETRARLMQAAVDLTLYRQTHGGYPATLELLPAAGAKLDPFSGKPFIYRLTPEGFLLWSVGTNGVDDGGKSADECPSNYDSAHPTLVRGGDIVISVPPKKEKPDS